MCFLALIGLASKVLHLAQLEVHLDQKAHGFRI